MFLFFERRKENSKDDKCMKNNETVRWSRSVRSLSPTKKKKEMTMNAALSRFYSILK